MRKLFLVFRLACSVSLTRKCMLVDLRFNLLRRVGQKNCGIEVAGRHLRLGALQCREESRVKQCRFRKSEPRRNVSTHSEVRILIDGARNEHRNLLFAENHRERRRERRRSLNCWERNLSDQIRVSKTENSFHLIECNTFLDTNDIPIVLWALPKTR